MNKQLVFWCWTAVLSATLGLTIYSHIKPFNVRAASTRAYTVMRVETGKDKAGNPDKVMNLYVEAQRGDGARARETIMSDQHQRDLYFPNGDEIITNDLTLKKSTYPRRYQGVPGSMDPAASCQNNDAIKLGWIIDGIETISGFRAVRRILNSSHGKVTVWNALDGGCAEIQLRMDYDDGVTTQTLKSLTLSEPLAEIFTVGGEFQESPPSGLFTLLSDKRKARLDANYNLIRANANHP